MQTGTVLVQMKMKYPYLITERAVGIVVIPISYFFENQRIAWRIQIQNFVVNHSKSRNFQ